MADINYWFDEYTREVNHYTTAFTTLQSLIETGSTNNRKIIQTIAVCDSGASKIKDVRKSCGLELRVVKDRAEKSGYDGKMKALDEKVMLMNKELKMAKMKQNKQELFHESTGKNQYSTEGEKLSFRKD